LRSTASDEINLQGKIVVSGLAEISDDESTLSLLKDQRGWSSIVLVSQDKEKLEKRFLSRSSRYSGLYDIVDFVHVNTTDPFAMEQVLANATAWLAFDVNRSQILDLAHSAMNAGVVRVIFTSHLGSAESQALSSLPEFDEASRLFSSVGRYFTGIRHGDVVDGDGSLPYEILNSSTTLPLSMVPRGVLGRVSVSLLQYSKAANTQCGISLSNSFTQQYLSILRQRGLSAEEEVRKIFNGDLDRFRNMYRNYSSNIAEKKSQQQLHLHPEEAINRDDDAMVLVKSKFDNFDEELEYLLNPMRAAAEEKTFVENRTDEILKDVIHHYQMRLLWKKLDHNSFLDHNREKARNLATQEFREHRNNRIAELMKRKSEAAANDNQSIYNENQLKRLLSLEQKELSDQQRVASSSIKYTFVLLELLRSLCAEKKIDFFQLSEFRQTIILRDIANTLRHVSNLLPHDAILDPLETELIIETLIKDEESTEEYLLHQSWEEIAVLLNEKHGKLFRKVSALQGVKNRIITAVETLKHPQPVLR
jgi:hypothetical protein